MKKAGSLEWPKGDNPPIELVEQFEEALTLGQGQLQDPWIARQIKNRGMVRPNVCVLGLGEGLREGKLVQMLAREGMEVMGVDTRSAGLERARAEDRTGRVVLTKASAWSLPFAGETFDAVCGVDLLAMSSGPSAVIFEASRILRPGGLLFYRGGASSRVAHMIISQLKGWFFFDPGQGPAQGSPGRFYSSVETKEMLLAASLRPREELGLRPQLDWSFWKALLSGAKGQALEYTFAKWAYSGRLGLAIKAVGKGGHTPMAAKS